MTIYRGRLYCAAQYTPRERVFLFRSGGLEVLELVLTEGHRQQIGGWVNTRQEVLLTGQEPEETARWAAQLVVEKIEPAA